MRIPLCPCLILHQRPYRETSLILEVLSREHGRVTLVAKGARRGKNKSQGLYQANRKLSISWSGRGEMGTLTGIEAEGPAFRLSGKSTIAAFYLGELLLRLLHKHESQPQLFDAYLKALTRLEHGEQELIALRYFEKHLLHSLGYGLVLDCDIETGQSLQAGQVYFYLPNHGPCLNKPDNVFAIEIKGASLLALEREDLDTDSDLAAVKRLMQISLKDYLGDKPLASRELFRAYSRQGQKTLRR